MFYTCSYSWNIFRILKEVDNKVSQCHIWKCKFSVLEILGEVVNLKNKPEQWELFDDWF